MNNKNDLLTTGPVKNYKPPKLPTLEESRGAPPLKVIPSRWKKNATVIACLGFAGVLTLSGCTNALRNRSHHGGAGGAPIYVAYPTEGDAINGGHYYTGEAYTPYNAAYPADTETYSTKQEILAQTLAQIEASELNLRTHWGGSGSGPFYVAHLTEQEVLGFIRAMLEAAGLSFDAEPPEYTVFGKDEVDVWWDINEMGIDLFDAEKNVAITSISWEDNTRPFSPGGRYLTKMVTEAFLEQSGDISFGVFYNPGETVGWGPFVRGGDDDDYQEATPEMKEEARPILIERLTAQVEEFIAWLQAEGII